MLLEFGLVVIVCCLCRSSSSAASSYYLRQTVKNFDLHTFRRFVNTLDGFRMESNKESICLHCSKAVNTIEVLRCHGFCGGIVHRTCTNLTKPNMNLVNEHANIFWFCDACVELTKNSSFRDSFSTLAATVSTFDETHRKALAEVKLEMEKNRKAVESLCVKSSTTLPSTPIWPVQKRSTMKRGRDHEDTSTARPNLPALVCGKKKFASEKLPASVIIAPPAKKCWIYLARFDPTVKEDDIRSMAADCLDTEDSIEVTKLVKKDANLSEWRFVAFKIGVDHKHRNAALSAETWPDGIYFREFIDTDRNVLLSNDRTGFRKTPRLE